MRSRSPFSRRFDDCHLDILTVSSTISNMFGSSPNPLRTASQSEPSSVGIAPVDSSPPSGETVAHALSPLG